MKIQEYCELCGGTGEVYDETEPNGEEWVICDVCDGDGYNLIDITERPIKERLTENEFKVLEKALNILYHVTIFGKEEYLEHQLFVNKVSNLLIGKDVFEGKEEE